MFILNLTSGSNFGEYYICSVKEFNNNLSVSNKTDEKKLKTSINTTIAKKDKVLILILLSFKLNYVCVIKF